MIYFNYLPYAFQLFIIVDLIHLSFIVGLKAYDSMHFFFCIVMSKQSSLTHSLFFCGCLILFACISLWCWELDVELIRSVPELTYLLDMKN